MADFDNANRGVLFTNDRREKETHPNYNGQANVVCPHCSKATDYWLSGWVRQSKSGTRFMSISVRPKDNPPPSQQSLPTPPPHSPDYDDDIPF